MVIVYARHSTNCKYQDNRDYRRCGCPLSLEINAYSKQAKKSAKTRSWELAEKQANKIEEIIQQNVNITPEQAFTLSKAEKVAEQNANGKTVRDALDIYLADMKTRKLAEGTIRLPKRMVGRLVEFAAARGVIYLKDVTKPLIREWEATWDFEGLWGMIVPHRVVSTFFNFCLDQDYIDKSPMPRMHDPKQEERIEARKQTPPFTPEEMERILFAVDQVGFKPHRADWVRALILLQRWSGFAACDAVMLRRDALNVETGDLEINRQKTGTESAPRIPKFVVEAILKVQMKRPHPDYFFYEGGNKPTTQEAKYLADLRKVLKQAGLYDESIHMKSHRFRDTFAVSLRDAGVDIKPISLALGHKTSKTTEQHYFPKTKEQTERVRAACEIGWTKPAVAEQPPTSIQ